MQLLAAAFDSRDEVGLLQNGQMFAHRLARHRKAHAQLSKRLSVVGAQPIKQLPSAGVGQRFEHRIHGDNMQPFGCLSSVRCLWNPVLEHALFRA